MAGLGWVLNRALRRAGFFVFWTGLVLMGTSFAGALHPIGDSFAVFRYWIALAVMGGVVLILRGWRQAIGAAFLVASLFVDPVIARIAPHFQPPPGSITLYQKNLWYRNGELPALAADIRAQGADIVIMQEVSLANLPIYRDLEPDLPTRLYCAGNGIASIAIMTRFPATGADDICYDRDGVAAKQVWIGGEKVWLVAIHLRWPWPKQQPQNLRVVLPVLEALEGRKIVAGDFNSVPWSNTLARISAATGTRRIGPVYRTLVGAGRFLRIPIDHVLLPGPGRLETRPRLGSDHLGLVASFDL